MTTHSTDHIPAPGTGVRPGGVRFSGLATLALAATISLAAGQACAQTQAPPTAPRKPAASAPAAPAATAPTTTRAPTAPAPTAAAPAPATGDDVVARVAGRDVTIQEVRMSIAGLPAEQQAALAREPALLSQTVRLMLANELVLKEANEKKWADQPAIAAQLARVRDSAIVETYLQAASAPPATFPEEAEIQKAYDANKSAFVVPRQFHVAQIFISVPAAEDPAGKKTAEDQAAKKLAEIQAKLKQPNSDFAAIAKESSDGGDTARDVGDLGWLAEPQIRPEIKSQLIGLSNNTVADPIRLEDGWHIVKLIDTKASETRALAEVRPVLIQRLRAQRADAMRRALLARALEVAQPAINELALTRVFTAPAPASPPSR